MRGSVKFADTRYVVPRCSVRKLHKYAQILESVNFDGD